MISDTNYSSGAVVETSDYLPFGTRWSRTGGSLITTLTDSTNRWRYSGKEEQKALDAALPLIDYGARMYDPTIVRWMSVDPLAEKYYPVGPYIYCAGNPVNLIDPSGRGIWEIDNEGRIVRYKENNTTDSFYIVSKAEDGTYERTGQSISFDYGTVISQRSISFSPKQALKEPEYKVIDTYDVYKIRGDEQGTQLFEFLSQNTSVEWSQAMTGIAGDKGLDFVTTGHMNKHEPGMKYLLEGQLLNGYTIRELNHSHPDNSNPSKNDTEFASVISGIMERRGVPAPSFSIFYVPTKQKIPFGR